MQQLFHHTTFGGNSWQSSPADTTMQARKCVRPTPNVVTSHIASTEKNAVCVICHQAWSSLVSHMAGNLVLLTRPACLRTCDCVDMDDSVLSYTGGYVMLHVVGHGWATMLVASSARHNQAAQRVRACVSAYWLEQAALLRVVRYSLLKVDGFFRQCLFTFQRAWGTVCF